MKILDFWMPKRKSEYVNWIAEKYPQDKASFKRMRVAQLKAIYILVRKKEQNGL